MLASNIARVSLAQLIEPAHNETECVLFWVLKN